MLDDGFVAKILVKEGQKNIPVGQPVIVVVNSKEDVDKFSDFEVGAAAVSAASVAETTQVASTPAEAAQSSSEPTVEKSPGESSGDRLKISPLAKKILEAQNIDPQDLLRDNVKGTGPNSRIRETDVNAYIQKLKSGEFKKSDEIQQKPVQTPQQALPTEKRVDGNDWTLQSKQTIPHYYLTVDVPVDSIDALVDQLNGLSNSVKVTRDDVILKAVSKACEKVPDTNAEWLQDQNVMRQFLSVNIETDATTINDVNSIGLGKISDARNGENKTKGTFSVYSFADSNIDSVSAIIKPGRACALTIGGARKEVVPGADDAPVVQSYMQCTLSCDHRLVDGAVGAKWLSEFKGFLANPVSMLL